MSDPIESALAEDVGDGDLTTRAVAPEGAQARARIHQKAPGVVAGVRVAQGVFQHVDPELVFIAHCPEGKWREEGAVAEISGSAAAILTAERVALNFLGRLSGVATLTARYVRAVEGTGVRILDTRKTTPGMRLLEKQAVAHGGGVNHRIGLFDFILIKENHSTLAGGVGEAVRKARAARPELGLAVEVRDGAEIDEALAANAQRLLLDNMTPDEVRAAVAQVGGRAVLEVSGGVDEETVLVYATISGVDYVSIGALTHSAPVLDLSLILETVQ
jgi:nicotinate-nucleotide pyrophosphorylase (carboxylating)